jgi:hypothetical protein
MGSPNRSDAFQVQDCVNFCTRFFLLAQLPVTLSLILPVTTCALLRTRIFLLLCFGPRVPCWIHQAMRHMLCHVEARRALSIDC